MMTFDECRRRIGSSVVYMPRHGALEEGVITSVNDRYVFVRYAGDSHSKATDPGSLWPMLGDA